MLNPKVINTRLTSRFRSFNTTKRFFNTSCGIVGAPNVGKSSLFNAFAGSEKAESSNFPFCTIDPNILKVPVPDKQLQLIGKYCKSKSITLSYVEIRDIAGLISGAALEGKGLGNQFLANVRGCNTLLQVVRCFDDEKVSVVEDLGFVGGQLDPVKEYKMIQDELILADIEYMEKRLMAYVKRGKNDEKMKKVVIPCIDIILKLLKGEIKTMQKDGKWANEPLPARSLISILDEDILEEFSTLGKDLISQLLTWKPILVICNVGSDDVTDEKGKGQDGNKYSKKLQEYLGQENLKIEINPVEVQPSQGLLDNGIKYDVGTLLIKSKNKSSSGSSDSSFVLDLQPPKSIVLSSVLEAEVAALSNNNSIESDSDSKDSTPTDSIDSESSDTDSEFLQDYLQSYGLTNGPRIPEVLRIAREELLQLKVFYTAGEDIEARAWFYPNYMKGYEASQVIHGDFPKRFQAVEIWKLEDIIERGWSKEEVKKQGLVRRKGKDCYLEDGAVVEFDIGKSSSGGNAKSMKA